MNLVLLAALARVQRTTGPLVDWGRAALFFYVVHLYLYGFVGRLLPDLGPVGMLPVWAAGLVVTWPACRWWRDRKAKAPEGSLLRLL